MFSKEYLKFIQDSKKQSLDIVGVSVIQTFAHTYAKEGNMILVNSKDEYVGVLGSPHLHEKILSLAKEVIKSKQTITFENISKDKNSGHGTSRYLIQPFYHCDNYGALGRAMNNYGKTLVRSIEDESFEIIDEKHEIKLEKNKFYQPIKAPYSLLIFGSGAHVSSLISMANLMAWKTTVIDLKIREEYVKEADELIVIEKLDDILKLDLSSYDASAILSHSPKTDDTYLKALLKSSIEYIGILGNKKNMNKKIIEFNLQNDKRFCAPIGLDIGGISHQSIALSICAQIEKRKNGKI